MNPGELPSENHRHLLAHADNWRYRAIADAPAGDWHANPADAAAPYAGRWTRWTDWPRQWHAFGPLDRQDRAQLPTFDRLDSMPDRCRVGSRAYPRQMVEADADGLIDLHAHLGGPTPRATAWLLATVHIATPQHLIVHAGADWWMHWRVGDRWVYRTPDAGNLHRLGDRAHGFELPLPPGDHLMAVRVIGGSGGWGFASEAVVCEQPPEQPRAIQIEACCGFEIDDPSRFASLTLEGDMTTLLNGQPLPPPLPGMRYRSLPGIPTDRLRTGTNQLTRRWRLEPGDAASRIAPLTCFGSSGEADRIEAREQLWAVAPDAADLQTGPLLSPGPGDQLTVTCRTTASVPVELRVGQQVPVVSPGGIFHQFHIPRTRDRLRCSLRPVRSPDSAARYAEPPPTPSDRALRIAVASDGGPLPEVWRHMAQLIEQRRPDLLVFIGDHVSRGRDDWRWDEQFITPARSLLARTPTCPVPGNHDENAPLMKRLWPIFGPLGHWSLSIGQALLIGLDGAADWQTDRAHADWLEGLLNQADAPFVFAFNHYPACSSGVHTRIGADGQPVEAAVRICRRVILPILQRHGVTALFSGHDHGYERFQPPRPPDLIVAAGAGAYLYADQSGSSPSPFPRLCRHERHHFTVIDVTPEVAELVVYDDSAETLDEHKWLPRQPVK